MSGEAEDNILLFVREIIARSLVVDTSRLELQTPLKDLDIDSLDIQALLIEIEDGFHCRLPEAEVAAWKTIGDVVASIKRQQSA